MWLMGIDPGLDGATVIVRPKTHDVIYVPHSMLPVVDGFISPTSYAQAMIQFADFNIAAVTMEYPVVLSAQRGAVKIGANWGIIRATVEGVSDRPLIVQPRAWKLVMIPKPISSANGKQASCIICAEIGYTVPMHGARGKKPHDGVADAILIAEYGGRRVGLL
jgi:hypothetical protein